MRPWPNPEIIAITPISEIVAAFLPRRCVVRDFVGWKAGRLAHLLRDGVKLRGQVLARHSKLPRRWRSKKAGLRLDGKLIERQMTARQRERLLRVQRAIRFGLPGLA